MGLNDKNKDVIFKSDYEYSEEEFQQICLENGIEIKNVDTDHSLLSEQKVRKQRYDVFKKNASDLRTKEVPRLQFKRFIYIFLAGFINALGVGGFLVPGQLLDGSMSGTVILVAHFINTLSIPALLLILNFPLFIFAAHRLNRNYLVYSLYAVACYSFFMWIIQDVTKLDAMIVNALKPISVFGKGDFDFTVFICAFFGGALSGLGSGLIIRNGGTLDGVEVVAVILSKKLGLSVGQIIMAYNIVMLSIAAAVLNVTSALLSIIAYLVAVKVIDGVVEGLDKAKAAMIISDSGLEIAKALNEQLGRGVTIINGSGFFQNNNKKIVYYVVNRFEITAMKDIVMGVDKNAFIAINEVTDVLGQSIKK